MKMELVDSKRRKTTAEEIISRSDRALAEAMARKPVYLPAYERRRWGLFCLVLAAAFLVSMLLVYLKLS
jgi:hypothetical protein